MHDPDWFFTIEAGSQLNVIRDINVIEQSMSLSKLTNLTSTVEILVPPR